MTIDGPDLLDRIQEEARVLRRLEEDVLQARMLRDTAILRARDAGLSLRSIAEAAGIHYTTILKIERGGGSR